MTASVFSIFPIFIVYGVLLGQLGAAEQTDEEGGDWFLDDEPVIQVSEGEITFIPEAAGPDVLLLRNRMTIAADSLKTGWVRVEQCYEHLDPVPDMNIVYRYTAMRSLRVLSTRNIGEARVAGQSVEMVEVGRDAGLCLELEAVKFHPLGDNTYVLKNGPFHRRFLDGFFPFRVMTDIRFPESLLQFIETEPLAQPGFDVDHQEGRVEIDARFAGTLKIGVLFKAR